MQPILPSPPPKSYHLQEATLTAPVQLSQGLRPPAPGRLVLSQARCLGEKSVPALPVGGSSPGRVSFHHVCPNWRPPG